MEIRSSLWHGTPSSGPVGGAHHKLSTHRRTPRSARARVVRKILALTLALGSIGAVTTAAVRHGSNVHSHGKTALSQHWMV